MDLNALRAASRLAAPTDPGSAVSSCLNRYSILLCRFGVLRTLLIGDISHSYNTADRATRRAWQLGWNRPKELGALEAWKECLAWSPTSGSRVQRWVRIGMSGSGSKVSLSGLAAATPPHAGAAIGRRGC